jgi:hypothetical protein
LLAKIGELATGDLVLVDASRRSRKAALERRVEAAEVLEVGLELTERLDGELGRLP